MSFADWFRRAFLDVEAVVHFTEKEIIMTLPQAFSDAIDRIKALLASHTDQSAADAQTISGLQAQVADLTSQGAAKDAQIADLTTRLSDATAQISDMENALLAVSPAA